MARPKKQNRRTRIVSFRLTDEEFAALLDAAAKGNLRFTELVRLMTLSAGKRLIIRVSAACDPALLKRLERIGHNLNQLVRSAHIEGRVPPAVAELCDEIASIVAQAHAQEWTE